MAEKEAKKSDVKVRHTVEMKDAPAKSVELVGNAGFKVQLERLRTSGLIDQSDEMLRAAGQGCISNPNGPGC
jgi:hypothetical protein